MANLLVWVKRTATLVEQDQRGVKRITRPMMGFKSFEAMQATLTGIELMQMLRKGQLDGEEIKDTILVR